MTPGIAPKQPPAGQSKSAEYAESLNGLRGIFRARGVVLAPRAEQRRDQALVEPDRRYDEPSHHSHLAASSVGASPRRSPRAREISSPRACRIPSRPSRSARARASCLATTTASVPDGSRLLSSATASRSSRFTRLRSTAPPTLRDTESPRRGGPSSPRGNTWSTSSRPACERPLRNTRSKSALLDSLPRPAWPRASADRCIRRSVACGPCRDGVLASDVLRGYASGRGNRVSARACAFSADTCVSSLTGPETGLEPVYAAAVPRPRSPTTGQSERPSSCLEAPPVLPRGFFPRFASSTSSPSFGAESR